MLADISNKSGIRLYNIRNYVDRIAWQERKSFVCISFSLLELFDFLDPLAVLALGCCLSKTLDEVFDVTADTEIYRNVLAYLRTFTIDMYLGCR